MIKFTKSNSITGTFKGVCIHNGMFVEEETGDVIDLAAILEQQYGNQMFDIKTSRKEDVDEE